MLATPAFSARTLMRRQSEGQNLTTLSECDPQQMVRQHDDPRYRSCHQLL